MPRRYRKHFGNRDKYSIEQTQIVTPPFQSWIEVAGDGTNTASSRQFLISIIPPITAQGMRKVKHITLTFSNSYTGENFPMLYTLVYVPEGYTPNPIAFPLAGRAMSMYEPNQFVMSSGVLDFSGGPLRIRTPLSRNLNSGDAIYLVLAAKDADNVEYVLASVRYAITLQ